MSPQTVETPNLVRATVATRNLAHHCSDRNSRNTDHTVALESVGSIGTRLQVLPSRMHAPLVMHSGSMIKSSMSQGMQAIGGAHPAHPWADKVVM